MRALRMLRARSAATVRERVAGAVACARAAGADGAILAEAAYGATDAEAARLLAQQPETTPACARGCASCCHVHVDVTSAEVEAVVRHLRGARSRGELDELVLRLQRTAGLSALERWRERVPCAFLAEDRACSIHAVRPLRCRAFHSYDAGACREAFAGGEEVTPPQSAALVRLHEAAQEGLEEALGEGGGPVTPANLEAGVLRELSR